MLFFEIVLRPDFFQILVVGGGCLGCLALALIGRGGAAAADAGLQACISSPRVLYLGLSFSFLLVDTADGFFHLLVSSLSEVGVLQDSRQAR